VMASTDDKPSKPALSTDDKPPKPALPTIKLPGLAGIAGGIAGQGLSALNKVPLPTSPRLKDLVSEEFTEEIKGSLGRFARSLPEGLPRSGKIMQESVLPAVTNATRDMLDRSRKAKGTKLAAAAAVDDDKAGTTRDIFAEKSAFRKRLDGVLADTSGDKPE